MMKKFSLLLIGALIMIFSAACAPQQSGPAKAELPAGKAYAEGNEIYFVHTEASDAGVAEKLTNMMQSPVVFVPSLASVPGESLANAYVSVRANLQLADRPLLGLEQFSIGGRFSVRVAP